MEPRLRSCGSCTLCCKTVAVEHLNKPTGVWCPYVCDAGCGIYSLRPVECRGFKCIWLDGHLGEDDRPDLLGVVFYEERTFDGELIVTVSESYPGAANSERVKGLIRWILEMKVPVVVRNHQTVTRANWDGRTVRLQVDPEDPLKVNVVKRRDA